MAEAVVKHKRSLVDVLIPRAQYGPTRLPGPTDDYWYEPKGWYAAGQAVTPRTALTLSGCWAASNAIAGLFGALPLKVYKKTAEGREEATKHDTTRILGREPNPQTDSFVFWEMMAHWCVNYGNAYAEKQFYDDSGRLYALWPIHPTRVKPDLDNNKSWTGRWLVRNNDGNFSALENNEMLNIVGNLSDDGITGKGVLTYAAGAIGIGLAQMQYEGDFYGNGGRPSGVLEHPSKLSPAARDALRREWREVHGKSNEVAVLWEGLKFNPLSVSPEHAELIESRTFSVQEMCRFYDVPPHVLYDLSRGTFANTEEMNRFLVSQPFGKRLVRFEKALDRQLFTDSEKKAGYYTKFNVNALLRGNPKEQAEVNSIKIRSGVITPDEARALDEMNPIPGGLGKNHFLARDMATMELIVEPPEVPTPASLPSPEKQPTPPQPKPNNARARMLAGALRASRAATAELSQKTKELEADLAVSQAAEKRYIGGINECESEIKGLKAEIDTIRKEHAEETGEFIDSIETLTLERDGARQHVELLTAQADKQQQSIDELLTAKTDLESAVAAARMSEATYKQGCIDAENALTAEKTVHNELKSQFSAQSAVLDGISQEKTELELESDAQRERADRASLRGDELQSRIDGMAVELGTLRAERDTLNASLTVMAKSREEALKIMEEHRSSVETAEKTAQEARRAAISAESTAKQRLQACQSAVSAAVRTLLDESLAALLAQEQHEVKVAARKPEQYKEITSSYYHHFASRLAAQLEQAALAMEATGAERVDTSKIVAKYVSESRSRIHNVFNTTDTADLRAAMRDEVDRWEPRKQPLLDWIGA